ncbi:peptide-methionine (R)-S-oxide reductase MsrB [Croceicoccus sp. F390]|uniref:peptide-methionine (R)-S-oxide reductase n=1 Tax=Croceicoccus esteveae TaxID=3075597 RepID=A0ABU2ZN58_9SPHN|nr:peptide-methionine (R)-S-oxide reductase MsrB [Croceicoccus sp. F390]MDT0576872.1 peptide-methionine (R)-S-oxide reductase MsrB [Croceicoccus sp. F390]
MENASRRSIIAWLSACSVAPFLSACTGSAAQAKEFPVSRSEDSWRKRLDKEEFRILRKAGTERPYSSPLNNEKRAGTYICAGCDNKLYSSATKFESGTGWPSFFRPLSGGIGTATDFKLGYPRKEVHCARCGGHLGHVFNDGPKPTGKRYCMNGAAMDFIAA